MLKRGPEGLPRFLSACVAVMMALTLLSPADTLALPNDQDQPIHISADTAVRDDKQGVTVYRGDVQMNQGSMYIEADELTIYHINEEADKIVAVGKPARMRQRPNVEKGPVNARAEKIEYFRGEERVHLQTNARIEQDGGIVSGDSIDYFIADELVKADSDQAREGNRVQVVIPPSMQQDAGISRTEKPTSPVTDEPAEPAISDPLDPNQSVAPASSAESSETTGTPAPADSAVQPEDGEAGTEKQPTDEGDSGATDSE